MELQLVWGWQPALYLFLGGLGAGAFIVAACLHLMGKKDHDKTVCFISWASFGCLAVGLLLLLTELIFPLRAFAMWQSFGHLSSWMAIGAWLLFAAVVFILIAAVALTKPLAEKARIYGKKGLLKVCFIAGGVLSLGVCAYTGVLLMAAPGVPLWNTFLLPCLFTISALDTGVALAEIVMCRTEKDEDPRARKLLALGVIALVAIEALVVLAFVFVMNGGGGFGTESYVTAAKQSIALLTSGELAIWFWLFFLVIGLAAPFGVAVFGLVSKKESSQIATYVGAACALVGGLTLRFLIVLAGVHADVVLTEVSKLIM